MKRQAIHYCRAAAGGVRLRLWGIAVALWLPLIGMAQTDTTATAAADSTTLTSHPSPLTSHPTTLIPQLSTLNSQLSTLNYHPSIGYLSYDSVLHAMPQYIIVEQQMADLRRAYDAELKRVEDEFNQKYEAFLDGRKDYPRTILLKRQTELQQLLERNVAFKQQSVAELEQQRQQLMQPLHERVDAAIATVAREQGLSLVVNTDSRACPFIEPSVAVDLTEAVQLMVDNKQ